ncbi:hypothetical protein J2I47_23715 [Fibrella sp. HMF5335]|uniref:Uncharacterized protein n=1 Tax=Fibrella rubiginis TaxID=2817060 RepID=A0A939K755_9BACT|nr:hypothetical protein [Fibrella rubiginis]MBO0939578.1 hypothetical protein [Fibrella rubiginis]
MLRNNTSHTLLVVALPAMLFLGCKKTTDPAVPDNVITDAGGINLTVTYDKTPTTTDLDLYIYRKNTYSAASNPQGATIGPNDNGTVATDIMASAPDEDYTVVVAYKTGTIAKPYTLTFKGISDKKVYTITGSFAASLATATGANFFGSTRGNNVTLTKSGTKFTVSQ